MAFLGRLLRVGAALAALVAILLGAAARFEHALPDSLVWYSRAIPACLGIVMTQLLGIDAKAMFSEFKALDAVLKKAVSGDPASVLQAIDETGWSGHFLINIGDVKGKFLDLAVSTSEPKLAVELGTFMGYSAVRIARLLPKDGRLISVDPSPQANAIATSVLRKAGLLDRVELAYDYSGNVFRRLAEAGATIDFLLIDHLKHLYLEDLKLALSLGLIKEGTVVVGDNVKFPGSPSFRAFVTNESNGFDTVIHPTFVEYSNVVQDEVTVSIYRR